jgi:outer membrane protein
MLKAAGLGLVILSSACFANSAGAAQKVGYIATNFIMSKLPQREAIMTKFQNELKDDRAELDKIRAEIQTKAEQIQRDGALLGEQAVENLKIEISSLQGKGKIKQEAFSKKAKAMEFRAQKEVLDLIQGAVKKIAEKEGFDMVIDSQSLQYAKPELNLTEKVLAELK